MHLITMRAFKNLLSFWALWGCFASSTINVSAREGESEGVGTSTNGIHASAKYSSNYIGDEGPIVSVFIHFASPSTNIEYVSAFKPGKYGVAKYFGTTNSFVGFVELKNTNGDKISMLKPWLNFPNAYPDSYSLELARLNLNKGISMGPELPGVITGADPEVGNFHLKRLFLIENPGEYQLTLWPKFYERSEVNHDLMERIDLPPVIVPIHWTEPHHNLQLSIRPKNNENTIITNGSVELLCRYQNNSSNETFVIYNQFPTRFDETCSFTMTSPTGKCISPNLPRVLGGSSSRDFLSPGQAIEFTVDVSGILEFNEVGTFQVIVRKRILTAYEISPNCWFTVASNPLAITNHWTGNPSK